MALCYHITSMLLLVLISSTHVIYFAQGRQVFMHVGVAKHEGASDVMVSVSSMIGSRPPICERRCISCGHCEAIQVPVSPRKMRHFSSAIINSRGDEYNSNYKPMNWKCKCGNRILNP